MVKVGLGDFDDILPEFGEDVVVFGHTHQSANYIFNGYRGRSHYVNSGTLIDYAEHVSFVT